MGTPSKEKEVIEPFFNDSSKHWHFEDIVKESKLTRDKVNKWLHRFVKEGVIKRIKPKGKMPYYVSNFENPAYKNRKRLYALNDFYESGFLNHIMNLSKANTVVIFGSFARSDWHIDSDIDLFIYGSDEELEKGKYETKLGREIQLFSARNRKDLKNFEKGLMKSIVKGDLIKGNLDFLEVKINA